MVCDSSSYSNALKALEFGIGSVSKVVILFRKELHRPVCRKRISLWFKFCIFAVLVLKVAISDLEDSTFKISQCVILSQKLKKHNELRICLLCIFLPV